MKKVVTGVACVTYEDSGCAAIAHVGDDSSLFVRVQSYQDTSNPQPDFVHSLADQQVRVTIEIL